MKNFKPYESFNFGSFHKKDEDEDDIAKETLSDTLNDIKPEVSKFLKERSLFLEEIEVESGEEFSILYTSDNFDGSIPNRISYYMEDLSKYFSNETGTNVTWSFAKNHMVTTVLFKLDSPIDPKYSKGMGLIRKGLI